jgi:hypothetical protein
LLVQLIIVIVGGVGLDYLARRLPRSVLDPQAAAYWTIGAVGGTFSDACLLAQAAQDHGDGRSELEFYRAAWALDASRTYAPAMLAGRLAEQGRCAEAQTYWSFARFRGQHPRNRGLNTFSDDDAVAWASVQLTNRCGGTGSPAPAEDEGDTE